LRLRASTDVDNPPTVVENTMDFFDTTVIGEWAIEYGTFKSVWRMPGATEDSTMSGNIMRVLRLQPDGSWKCARAMWNLHDTPPADQNGSRE